MWHSHFLSFENKLPPADSLTKQVTQPFLFTEKQALLCTGFPATQKTQPFPFTHKLSPAGFPTKQATMALSRTNKLSPHSCRFSNKTGDNGPFTYKQTLSSLLQVFQQNRRQWPFHVQTNSLLTPAGFPTKPSDGETMGRGTSDRLAWRAPPRGRGWRRGWSTAPGRPSPPPREVATTCPPSAPICRSLCPPEPHTRRCTLHCR